VSVASICVLDPTAWAVTPKLFIETYGGICELGKIVRGGVYERTGTIKGGAVRGVLYVRDTCYWQSWDLPTPYKYKNKYV
jgi:hypothetical protein